ncbi:MAG: DUF2764 family protein [Planctomycetes bacterium]|nr:DUF2764 family protein [Planctomycetota bacterium]
MVMQAYQYYFMTSLPALPGLGENPPISLAELCERSADMPEVHAAVTAVLLEHDLMLRQGVLAGELEEASPAVLTEQQSRGEAPLPGYLQVEGEKERLIGDDATWEAYFRHVAAIGKSLGSPFLCEWVGFEVSLRNALVIARAKVLELTADEYIVAAELADKEAEVEDIVGQWSSAENPLAAQLALDQGRWDWLSDSGVWFSFSIDEVAAYARGLVLLHRWRRFKKD